MANWQASLLMQTLSTGSVLVLQRDKTDAGDVPTLHGGDTFNGSLPDGDPFGGTVMERHEGRAVVEVNQKRYHLHKAQPHQSHYAVTVELAHEFWVIDGGGVDTSSLHCLPCGALRELHRRNRTRVSVVIAFC